MQNPASNSGDVPSGAYAALGTLFELNYGALCTFVHRYVRSRAVAEELVQDLFVELWEGRERRALETVSRAYLYRSARNRALNHVRHQKIVEKWEAEQSTFGPSGPSGVVDPEEEDRLKALVTLIETTLASLPPRCREAFLLVRDEGLSYREAAQVMGIAVNTVDVHVGRALKELKARLAEFRRKAE